MSDVAPSAEKDAARRWWHRRPALSIRDVPCGSCVEGYDRPHVCDSPDYCPCDRAEAHVLSPAECAGCVCRDDHDGDYGAAGHAGPCPPHTCVTSPGSDRS